MHTSHATASQTRNRATGYSDADWGALEKRLSDTRDMLRDILSHLRRVLDNLKTTGNTCRATGRAWRSSQGATAGHPPGGRRQAGSAAGSQTFQTNASFRTQSTSQNARTASGPAGAGGARPGGASAGAQTAWQRQGAGAENTTRGGFSWSARDKAREGNATGQAAQAGRSGTSGRAYDQTSNRASERAGARCGAGESGQAAGGQAAGGQAGSSWRADTSGQAGASWRADASGQAGSAWRAEASGQAGAAGSARQAGESGNARQEAGSSSGDDFSYERWRSQWEARRKAREGFSAGAGHAHSSHSGHSGHSGQSGSSGSSGANRQSAGGADQAGQERRKTQQERQRATGGGSSYQDYRQRSHKSPLGHGRMTLTQACALLCVVYPCSAEDVKTAYRKQARRHHPDLGGDEEMMKSINQAYELALSWCSPARGRSAATWAA